MSAPVSSLDWRAPRGGADVVLSDARVLDPRARIDSPHDVVIRNGEIAELAAPGTIDAADAERLDCSGMIAAPAFFDPHVHLRTPGEEHKEDLETGTRAAAAGGYCGIVAMANTKPPVSDPADVHALREQAGEEARVPTGFVATLTRGMAGEELTDMVELRQAGAVGFSDDGLPITSARVLRRALAYQRLCGGPVLLHEEDPELSAGGSMHEGEVSAILGIAGIPSISESTMIVRDCQIAGYEDGLIQIQHLSAKASVAEVERAKAAGVRVSAEASPHHLTLTDEELRALDSRFKMNPPLRSESDRQALIAGLRSGVIDCVATDHAPHAVEDKEVPLEEAAFGVTGLETAFAVLNTELVRPGLLELSTLIERMSAGTAAFDLEPPTLAPGSEANVVVIDPDLEWEAGADGWESRSENSCFAGRTLCGKPLATVVAGRTVYRERRFAIAVA